MSILRLSTVALTIVLFTMGALILPVNTALAHCKGSHKQVQGCDIGGHPHDGTTGDSGGDPAAYYSAIWDGDVKGNSGGTHDVKVPFWVAGNKKSIGLNIGGGTPGPLRNVGQLTDLSFFRGLGVFNGSNCFDDTDDPEGSNPDPVDGFMGQATVKKAKHGNAEAHFWFLGYTEDGPQSGTFEKIIPYLLVVTGENDRSIPGNEVFVPDVWPPETTTTMTVNTWELSIEGGASGCEGSGMLNSSLDILVTLED